MTRWGRLRELRALLEGVLVASAAVTTSGCCGPFGRNVEAASWQTVRPARPELLVRARTDAEGEYDAATCSSVCGAESRCWQAEGFAIPFQSNKSTKSVECKMAWTERYGKAHPSAGVGEPSTTTVPIDEEHFDDWSKSAGPGGALDRESCFRACAPRDADFTERDVELSCSLRATFPPPERPFANGERLVVCHLSHDSYCASNLPSGRNTRGIRAPRRRVPRSLGALHSRVAKAEAVSVLAFERLADELAQSGAPRVLVDAARDSAVDEARHTVMMAELAASEGRPLLGPPRVRFSARRLVDIAIENAVEGCVGESFGALLAMHQAEHAESARVRRALRRIARDEVAHAALSFRVHAWISSKLGPREKARVERAMERATRRLLEPKTFATEEVARKAGLPPPEKSAALGRMLAERLRAG